MRNRRTQRVSALGKILSSLTGLLARSRTADPPLKWWAIFGRPGRDFLGPVVVRLPSHLGFELSELCRQGRHSSGARSAPRLTPIRVHPCPSVANPSPQPLHVVGNRNACRTCRNTHRHNGVQGGSIRTSAADRNATPPGDSIRIVTS